MHRFAHRLYPIAVSVLCMATWSACDAPAKPETIVCDTTDDCPTDHLCENKICVDIASRIPTNCGNGAVDAGEICDDGEHNGQPNHCSRLCDGPTPSTCGNGIVEDGEECDDVGASAQCNADCTRARCGDGILNTWAGETCDDGENNGQPNRCNTRCNGITDAECGNGVIEDGEVCDDGENNGQPNHCARTCQRITKPICGNGIIEDGEACDDGQETANCNLDCTLATCGDGIINEWAGEICDDGENNGRIGYCNPSCSAILSCGNGAIDPGEICDDGDNNGEPGYCNTDCSGVDQAVCGNGILEDGEACDDGKETATCNSNCTLPTCGDGITNYAAGEACDDGQESFACNADCTAKPVAFRLDTVQFIDPHLYFSVLGCRDITHEGLLGQLPGGANGMLQEGLDKTTNGTFNTSLALLTRPLMQQADAQTHVDFLFPKCDAPLGECTNDTSKPFIESTLTNQESGYCFPIQEHLGRNPKYTGLHKPVGPCFMSEPMNIDINIRGISLALSDARVTATYAGDAATHLTDGVLVGFLTEQAAQEAIVPAPEAVGGDTPLYDFLKGGGACGSGDDSDVYNGEKGWWFYLNFTAVAADAWNE